MKATDKHVITHERIYLAAILRDAEKRLRTAQSKVEKGHGKAIEFALLRVREALEAAIHQAGKIR